ncbi:unnamed protein product, partial [marine sediment metagenome]
AGIYITTKKDELGIIKKWRLIKQFNKWFAEAQEKLVQVDDDPTIDTYFRSIFGVLPNYCPATILLIKKRRSRLPAMALMQVMSELFIKFLWCVLCALCGEKIKENNGN